MVTDHIVILLDQLRSGLWEELNARLITRAMFRFAKHVASKTVTSAMSLCNMTGIVEKCFRW
jgi:hypothetical protein